MYEMNNMKYYILNTLEQRIWSDGQTDIRTYPDNKVAAILKNIHIIDKTPEVKVLWLVLCKGNKVE